MNQHEQLKQDAKSAIDKVMGDRSVSKFKTVESLEELASDLECMIDALNLEINVEDDDDERLLGGIDT